MKLKINLLLLSQKYCLKSFYFSRKINNQQLKKMFGI